VGIAFVEYALRVAITTYLRKDLTKRETEKMLNDIFDDYDRAPLSSLSLKTRMAYALGIVDRRTVVCLLGASSKERMAS
jgi:hypothetical protein